MFFNKLRKLERKASQIDALGEKYSSMIDEQLKDKTKEFQKRLIEGEPIDNIAIEAFATVREVAKRTIGLYPYKVQLLGGLTLNDGNIAEMRTGEGKTLVAPISAYLNAIEGRGVHIVTVNDYLAKRDKETMAPIFEFLGLTVGLIQGEMNPSERQEAYACDITYVTNNELGFDYLRDNMAKDRSHKVLRGLNYCIIDEVDSILIDEARTPLIISGVSQPNEGYYVKADIFFNILKEGRKIETDENASKLERALTRNQQEITETGDYIVDKKEKRVHLTSQGIAKAENFFKFKCYTDPENLEIIHYIDNALKANALFKKDIDYIIQDGKIEIVDEFTGRILKGRRYSNGLHQAIEVKEGVVLQPESKTLASITYQNLFRLYRKISGMTGTAKTEEIEFRDLYNMDVVVIPTNKPITRIDQDDVVFLTEKEKYAAIVSDIKQNYEKGRPVLVGTTNIEVSELISTMLNKVGVKHTVLNAKHHEQEAEIISRAGEKNGVTVATNMAGRGTDIKLGKDVVDLGGLKVIGTERHESRRIDNQLRGRSGRQGDPGETIFYLSLEDDLMNLFGASKYISLFKSLGTEQGYEIKHPLITKSVEKAQKSIESRNYGSRKSVMEFDNIINKQRMTIYRDRNRLFEEDGLKEVLKIIDSILLIEIQKLRNSPYEEKNIVKIRSKLYEFTGIKVGDDIISPLSNNGIVQLIKDNFTNRIKDYKKEVIADILKHMMFDVIDQAWSEHIDVLSNLQRDAGLYGAAGKDPVQEFFSQSYELFNALIEDIQIRIVRLAFKIDFKSIFEQSESSDFKLDFNKNDRTI
ncbi:preprotein translocase subunit SecA [Alkaliphilus sp. B6464]|uniref:preprotein translocase subunit SecA n=1 Tax=Alkaliphilus sp. B6464 TaxID=2731219 RepID=UPI001BABBC69|nr:preprotein translocase subunit SecA [Alkaliphilus sp. B6464]QUH22085.1 preprotein translocase subunit SecA [Alkaliphilus sp. B6464]